MEKKQRKAAILAKKHIKGIASSNLSDDVLEERVDAAIVAAREEKYATSTVCAREKVGEDFDKWLAGRSLSIGVIKQFLLESSEMGYRASSLITRKSHLLRHLRLKYHFKVARSDLDEVSSLYWATSNIKKQNNQKRLQWIKSQNIYKNQMKIQRLGISLFWFWGI